MSTMIEAVCIFLSTLIFCYLFQKSLIVQNTKLTLSSVAVELKVFGNSASNDDDKETAAKRATVKLLRYLLKTLSVAAVLFAIASLPAVGFVFLSLTSLQSLFASSLTLLSLAATALAIALIYFYKG